ncbi:hypothetical protein [Streptomyces sp. NPDC057617]|uniref:hypothetical protein n=1 Tax=Streptomyces sp. NPDC057617 TaxID=3346184 RepID=UPI003682256B
MRPAAPFVVLLHRRSILLSSAVVPSAERISDDTLVSELVSHFSAAALEADDIALAQLMSWSSQVWAGRRYDVFDSGQSLPPTLMHQLSELLHTTPSPVMLQATGTALLHRVSKELHTCADYHANIDKSVTAELFLKPVAAVLEGLAVGAADDRGLLSHTPEELVTQAAGKGGAKSHPIDPNSARWRRLVQATADIADQVRRIMELAAIFRWRQPEIPPLESLDCSELDPALVPVLGAALHVSTDPGAPRMSQGKSVLAEIAAEALAEADPQSRHHVAVAVRFSGLAPQILEPALAPLERLRLRTQELMQNVGSAGADVLGPLGSMVTDALARGDLEEAEQGVELLSEARAELDIALGLERARAALSRQTISDTAAELDLRTADMHLANGDAEAAATYLQFAEDRIHGRTGIKTADGEATASAEADPGESRKADTPRKVSEHNEADELLTLLVHPAHRGNDHSSDGSRPETGSAHPADPARPVSPPRDEVLATVVLSGFQFDATPEARSSAETALRALSESGAYETVTRVGRQLTHLNPGTAADLLESSVARFPPVARPVIWQLLEQALRASGQHTRADEVFRQGHPPLPPPELRDAIPVADVTLAPRLWPLIGAALGRPDLAEAARAADENDAPRAAAAFSAASRAGARTALGLAIGWSVVAGSPAAGLDLYREVGSRQYLNASAVWNIACAYAAVGADELAVESLRVMARVLPGRPAQAQKDAADRFCARLGLLSPFAAAVARREPALAISGEQTRESLAKQMYERGEVNEAARELEELLHDNPSSPGAFLMLRICRELGDLPRAEAVVQRIAMTRGALNWRHHIELARTALDSRCADYTVARRELDRARELKATDNWTGPLEQRLREARVVAPSTTGTLTRSTPPRTDDPSSSNGQDHGASLRDGGLLELLHEARTGLPHGATTLTAVVGRLRAVSSTVPRGDALGTLLDDVVASHDDYLVREVAHWLLDVGQPTEALRVVERCFPWAAPEKVPRLIHLRDRAAVAAGVPLAGLHPPGAPRLRRAEPPAPARRLALPTHQGNITGPLATQPTIRAAQQPPPGSPVDYVADAWTAAAREHPVALSNALGCLVIAGRPEEALLLHDELADTLWLTAGAAWNLGCAYAATGRLEAAASSFEYFATVSSRRFDPSQTAALRGMFASVGRSMPTPAVRSPVPMPRGMRYGTPTATAQLPHTGFTSAPDRLGTHSTLSSGWLQPSHELTEAESNAAQRIAQCLSAPSGHNFRLASDAARRAMRAGGTQAAGRYVATMRELFSLQPEPQPDTAASMAMVLETAERYENAWELLTEWIGRTRADSELLAPAVRVARVLHRAQELWDLLLPYDSPDAGFELHLNLAKLAQLLKRNGDLVRHADLALQRNPTCAEAAILRNSVSGLPRRDHQQATSLRQRIAANKITRQQAIAMVEAEYGPTLAVLRVQALARFQPATSRKGLERHLGDHHKIDAAALLAAAEEEDWELASDHAWKLLDKEPRDAQVARVAADCLIEAKRDEEVRTVAALVGPPDVRRDILVRLACARGDYTEAVRLLSGVREWYAHRNSLLAHAGLLAEADMGASPADAVQLLLLHARLTPRSETLAALAAILADRAGRGELVDEAVELLRRTDLPPMDILVDSALSAQVPEALNGPVPPLNRDQLQRVADHLHEDPARLIRFLRAQYTRAGGSAGRHDEEVSRALLLGRALDSEGMLASAVEAHREAQRAGGDPSEILQQLTDLCTQWRFGDPVVDAEQLLAGDVPTEHKVGTEIAPEAAALVSQAAECTPGPALAEHLEHVTAALSACASGLDVLLCERIGQSWQRQLSLILQSDDRKQSASTSLETHDRDVHAAIRKGDSQTQEFASLLLREQAHLVQSLLRGLWDAAGRERLRTDAAATGPLSWRAHKATRLEGGPVEVQLELRAGSEVLSGVTVQVRGTDVGKVIGNMEAGTVTSFFLVVQDDATRLTVHAEGTLPDQRLGGAKDCVVKVRSITRQERLVSRFRPGDPVTAGMFVGRAGELDRLRAAYGDAWHDSVPLLFMTGSRRAGKTSLIRQITRLRGGAPEALLPPDRWRIPRVFPVLLDGQSVDPGSDPLLTWIAKEVRDRVEEFYEPEPADIGLPGGPHAVDFRRWWRAARRVVWPQAQVGLLLIVDELQELLRRYDDRESLARTLGDLRRLRQDGTLALLFSGSCTTAQLQEQVAGTLSQQDFSRPLEIGPLDRQATLQVVHQGFSGTDVEVLSSAAELVFRHTSGHPHHVHMVGQRLSELLEANNRTVIDTGLVDDAFDWVSRQDEAVRGIIDPYTNGEDSLELLFRIAQELDANPDEAAVRGALIDDSHKRRLDDYLDYGLLVRDGANLTWANSVVESWLRNQNAPWEDGSQGLYEHEKDLRPHYQVTRRYESSLTSACDVQQSTSPGVTFVARHYPEAPQAMLSEIRELLSDTSSPSVSGLPDRWKQNGSWLIHRKIVGSSLTARLTGSAQIDHWAATRLILSACDTVAQVWETHGMSHGDIRPGNLIVADGREDDELYVVGWGHGSISSHGRVRPLLRAVRSLYYPDTWLTGRTLGQGDDAFALSAVLYQLLDRDQRLPWDESNLGDWENYRLALHHAPPSLRAILHLALGNPSHRYRSAHELAEELRRVLPQEIAIPEPRPALALTVNQTNNSTSHASNKAIASSEARMSSGKYEISAPVTGSVIGEGNDNSNNSSSYTGDTIAAGAAGEDLSALVARLREELDRLRQDMPPGDARDVDASVEGLAEEAESEQPNTSRIRRLASLARDILDSVSGAAAAVAALQTITDVFGS